MKKILGMLSVFLLLFIFNEEDVLAEEYVKTLDITKYSGEALMIKVDGGVLTKITNGNGKIVDNYANKLFNNIWIYPSANTSYTLFDGNIINVHVNSENSNFNVELTGGKDSSDYFDFTGINLEMGNFIDYRAYTANGDHEMRMDLVGGSTYLLTVDSGNDVRFYDGIGQEIFYNNSILHHGSMVYHKFTVPSDGEYKLITEGGVNKNINVTLTKYNTVDVLNILLFDIKQQYNNYYSQKVLISPELGKNYALSGFTIGNSVNISVFDNIKKFGDESYCLKDCVQRSYRSEYIHRFDGVPSYKTFKADDNSIGLEYLFKANPHYNGESPNTIFNLNAFEYVPKTGDNGKYFLEQIQAIHRNYESSVGDPVDSASGAFFDTKSLLKYGGSNPLEFSVKYNSILNNSGNLANGWVHNYESSIEEFDDTVNINWDPNSKMIFYKDGFEYIAKDIRNKEVKLSKNSSGNFLFVDRDRSIYIFDSNNKLKSIESKTGSKIYLTYDVSDKLIRVENTEKGQYFSFEYNSSNKLIKVTDRLGREVLFNYSNGNLDKIIESNGKVLTFTYLSSSGNKIGTIKSNEGNTFVSNVYDEFGRVSSQRDGRSGTTYFSYDDFSEEGKIKTVVKDRLGKIETYIHDDKYQLIGKTDKNGNNMYKEYDQNGNIIKEIDFNGNEVNFEYDEHNNLIKETYEDGKFKTFEYDLNQNLLKIVDEDLNETINSYDDNNQLTKLIDSRGNITEYIYNDQGYLWKIKDSINNETTYEYDLEGNLIGLIDKEGKKTTFENDVVGRVIKTILPEGNITQTVYDGKGNVIKVIDENGEYIENTYDSFGSILTKRDKLGRLTTYTYDGNGNLTNEQIGDRKTSVSYDYEDRVTYDRDKMDKTHSYVNDNLGRVIKETDRDNNVTEYVYDNNGNVIKKTLNSLYIDIYEYDIYDNVIKHIDADGKITLFEYNSKGLLIKETNHLGYVHKYNYDSVGNLTSEEDAEGRIITYVYDSLNKLISKTDARGNTWLYEYNKNGLLTKEINPLDQYIKNEYNDNGNLLKVYNSLEEVILENIYDNLGRIIETKDALGNSKIFEYDKVGNLIKSFDSNGDLLSEYIYNNFDEVTIERDINGNEKKFEYNKKSELIKSIDELNRNQQYRYDGIGRLLEVTDKNNVISKQKYNKLFGIENYTDANNYTTTYLYDKLGRLLSENNSNSNKLTYEYNSLGFMTKYINARNQSALYEYDKLGNILKITEGSKIINFEYDENNNVLKVKETGKGNIERVYDELNRVISYKDVYGNIIGYEYDNRGNLSKMIYPGNLAVTYEYDLNSRLIKVKDWHQNVTSYNYDVNGRLTETYKPDGSSEVREYNNKGQLALLKNLNKLGNVISEDIFSYDLVGNIITEGDENYQYDVLDRLLQSNKSKYTYDKGGNLLTYNELVNGNEIKNTFTYYRDNRITKAFNTTTNLDADGNLLNIPINGVFKTGVYDSRNRLISIGNDIYSYDSENTRTSVVENGIETRFLVDKVSNDLSRTLLETDKLGNVKNYYIYGLGLINSYNSNNSVGSLEVYHYDMRGSTISLTNIDSSIIGNVKYDSYGEILSKDDSIETTYLYNGKLGVRTDDSGLYYMRARYYSPELKRFINRDIVVGNLSESQTFNRFSYVNGNPISYIDPFGLSRSTDGMINITMGGILHFALEGVGYIPVAGEIADGLNVLFYLAEGDEVNAAIASGAMIPIAGWGATAGKWSLNLGKKNGVKNNFDRTTNANDGCNCFTLGTKVLTEDGEKSIEEVEIGDKVLSRDEETGEQSYKEVEWLFEKEVEEIYEIHVGGEVIQTTDEHPFWVVEENGWVMAQDLLVGDHFIDVNGNLIEIERIVKKKEIAKVYNFKVADNHNYYVSNLGIWTHNSCDNKIDLAQVYADIVNSNKVWSWEKDFPLKINKRNEQKKIRQDAINRGLIPQVPMKPDKNRYPDFESAGLIIKKDILPKEKWLETDVKQFDWLDKRISGGRPEGTTWHHSEIDGQMELVPFGIHNIINHKGGRSNGHWAHGNR